MKAKKKSVPVTYINRDFMLQHILRLQAFSKLMAAAQSAEEFRNSQRLILEEATTLNMFESGLIDRTFAAIKEAKAKALSAAVKAGVKWTASSGESSCSSSVPVLAGSVSWKSRVRNSNAGRTRSTSSWIGNLRIWCWRGRRRGTNESLR